MTLRDLMAPVVRGDLFYATRPRGKRLPVDPGGADRDMRSDAEAALWAKTRALPVSWLPQDATVMDVGCGPGKLKVARPDLTVFGYEPNGPDMETAKARGVKQWAGGDADGQVDALFCMDVVEHMERPGADLRRHLRSLRTGGLVIIECPDFWCAAAQHYGDRFRLLHDPDHVSLFTTESLIRMLRDLGVMIEDVAFPFYGGHYDTRETALARFEDHEWSSPAPGNLVAVRGRKR